MIEISHVNKWYTPTFQVLTDCTTSVTKGEVVVVCGPSGSGKSTLIKCVNALEPFQERRHLASTAPRSTIPRPICRNCVRASAWCSSISSCFRT